MTNFSAKSVFISGGSKGVGLACSRKFAKEGIRILYDLDIS